MQAVQAGEMTPLMNLLAEDVTFWADGGGKVKQAALRPIAGRVAVARFILESYPIIRRSLPEGSRIELTEVNGQPALITRAGDQAFAVLTIEVEAQHIKTIRNIVNPEKLAHV
jgi:RNA polymerase sigma-70 factor (ECF subfamily)